ncbi:MAG: tetratricopeptide repeat protein, partial [Pseudobdellovibrionaceae bacterium]
MKLGSFFPLILRRALVLILVTLSCGLQATAIAADPPPESPTTSTLPLVDTPTETPAAETQQAQTAEPVSWPSFEKAFEAGVASYQAKKYDEARLAFTQALEKEPLNVQALTNLALVQFQLGRKAWAVALLRKAHNLNPDFSTPKASLEYILPQLDVKEIPHEIQMWETIRTNLIVPFTLTGFLTLTALCLFATGWLWLQYIGKRREAFREEKPDPAFPAIPIIIALIFTTV